MTKWGRFLDHPFVEFLEDGVRCLLREDFRYEHPDGKITTVPEGFVCDGASIPKILWPIADSPFTGSNLRPALIHDYYCFLGRQGLSPYSSSDVHYLFHQGLRACGDPWWKARSKWLAVKTFGPHFPGPGTN